MTLVYHTLATCNRQSVTQWSIAQHYLLLWFTWLSQCLGQQYLRLQGQSLLHSCYASFCRLYENRISDEDCAALSKCLQECRELKTLKWVWSNPYVITRQPHVCCVWYFNRCRFTGNKLVTTQCNVWHVVVFPCQKPTEISDFFGIVLP